MLRTLACCLILLLGAWCPSVWAAQPVLRVGYFDIPPHARAAGDSQHAGAAIAYFRLIAREMGVQPVFVHQPLARLLAGGDVDALLFVAKTPERAQRWHFASRPLFTVQGALLVRADSPLQRVQGSEDLLPLTIGVWSQGYRSPLLDDPRLKLAPMAGSQVVERNIEKLLRGWIQAYYSPDQTAMQVVLARKGLEQQLRLLPLPEEPRPLYTAFSAASAAYLPVYEAALRKVQQRTPYPVFLQEYRPAPATPAR